jgi:hypothetical protein
MNKKYLALPKIFDFAISLLYNFWDDPIMALPTQRYLSPEMPNPMQIKLIL